MIKTFIKPISKAFGLVFLTMFALSAYAQDSFTGSYTGGCVIIADDAYDGTIGSMTCVTIDASAVPPGATASDITVELATNHTWVGDLTVKVVAPDGSVTTLQSRAGFAEPADDGMGCCGSFADLVAGSPNTFDDAAGTSAEDMGSSGLNICQVDGICTYFPFPDTGPGTNLADFGASIDASGVWQICVGDSFVGDIGEICGATLNFNIAGAIPTLGEWGLIILAMLLMIFALVAIRNRSSVLKPTEVKA